MRGILISGFGLLAAILLLAALVGPQTDAAAPAPPAASTSGYTGDALSRASAMTQQMSSPGPITGHEYHGHTSDEQLRLSANPAFVRELEAYQSQIDQMLAKTP